jgi:hypothetical protein
VIPGFDARAKEEISASAGNLGSSSWSPSSSPSHCSYRAILSPLNYEQFSPGNRDPVIQSYHRRVTGKWGNFISNICINVLNVVWGQLSDF